MIPRNNVPTPHREILERIHKLKERSEYLGAFVFGSIARGEANGNSDIDAKIVVTTPPGENCIGVSHPMIFGVKLDITYHSLKEVRQGTDEEIKKRERVPMIAESLVVFDKTGELRKIRAKAKKVKPRLPSKKDLAWYKFGIYHADNKSKRLLATDPGSARLAMGINLNEVLKYHYKMNRRWWISNKRLFSDLLDWDPVLAGLLKSFAASRSVRKQYEVWLNILDHVSGPLGEWRDVEETSCNCHRCSTHLRLLGV